MRKISNLNWKLIGCIIIFLILSVNIASAINNQNNTDGSRTPDESRNPDTNNNTGATNNNINSSGDNDLSTTYNYKGVYIDLPENIPTPFKIMKNWAGDYMLPPKFLDCLGIHHPHGHGIIYVLKCILYAILIILGTLAWIVYSLGWLIVTLVWGLYVLVMGIVNLFMTIFMVDEMDKLSNITGYLKYYSENRTVVDPEKVMGKFYNNIFHNTSGENNSSILGNGLLFYPVDPLNINPNINNSNNVTITNNDGDNDTNKTNDTVVYDVMNSIIGSDIPDENGNINCSNVTNSTNCINSNNIINSDNVVNSNYVSDSNGIANSSNIINSINVTNSSNVTNSNTIVGSNNILKSNIISSSNDINDCNNLNGINSSINLNNSVNSINLKDSDNLINCSNVTNSSNSIGCNDSVLLINCINSKNATNCSNSTYVFDMENRTNEKRLSDGYLHVLSTKNCKDGNGTFNPVKIKFNGSYDIGSNLVDENGYITFFTLNSNDLDLFFINLTKQIDVLNSTIETTKDNEEATKWSAIALGIASGIALIVGIALAAPTTGESEEISTETLEENEEHKIIEEVADTTVNKGLKKGLLQRVTTQFYQPLPAGEIQGLGMMNIVNFDPIFITWNIPKLIGFFVADAFYWGGAAAAIGLGVTSYDLLQDIGKDDKKLSYEEDVLITSVLEKMFRLENKIIVD
jgi:hypothetical protein